MKACQIPAQAQTHKQSMSDYNCEPTLGARFSQHTDNDHHQRISATCKMLRLAVLDMSCLGCARIHFLCSSCSRQAERLSLAPEIAPATTQSCMSVLFTQAAMLQPQG